jgi:hypothetical protein
MTATTTRRWKLLGKNDEVTTCECCGKVNLKLTVIMTDGENEVRYGRDCAARLLAPYHGRLTALRVQRMAEEAAEKTRQEEIDRQYYRNLKLRNERY